MGTQTGITGRIGNVIYYKMGGKYYMRAAPRKYKQTMETKARAKEFGKASTLGSIIRMEMGSLIFNSANRKMQTQLVAQVFDWLQRIDSPPPYNQPQMDFLDFNFSPGNPGLARRLLVPIGITMDSPAELQIAIPALIPRESFRAPARTADIICKIATVVIDPENLKKVNASVNEIIFHFDNNPVEAQTITTALPTDAGKNLILTAMALEYHLTKARSGSPVIDSKDTPAQMVHAVFM